LDKKDYTKQWRIDNKEKIKDYSKQYYIKHKEEVLEKGKQYREKNPKYFIEYYQQHKEETKIRTTQWRQENIERVRLNNKQWQENNPEKVREKSRRWRQNNPEKAKEMVIRWRKNNPEKDKESHERYRQNNPDKVREEHRISCNKKYKTNMRYRLNVNMCNAINKSLKGNKAGRHWESLVGYTRDDLINHLNKTIPEGYTWQDYLNGILHVDHIVPKSIFNFNLPEHIDFKRCWALDNLRLLPAKENIIKSNKIIEPFQPTLKIIFNNLEASY